MKVNNVQGVAQIYETKLNTTTKTTTNVTSPLIRQELPLADNYGRAMINFKAGKIKNIKNMVMHAPIEDKLAVILSTLELGSLLVVSNNLKNSLSSLKDNVSVLDFPVNKVFHLHNTKLNETLAFAKADDFGNYKFYNVNENSVILEDLGIPLEIDPADSQTIGLGARVQSSIGWLQIKEEPETVNFEDIEAYMPALVDEIDCSKQLTLTIIEHNKQILADEPKQEIKSTGPKFRDVGGQDEVIEVLKKNMLFPFKHPEVFTGFMLCRGAVLHGEPGTGKTFLADAFVNESGATPFRISGTELAGKYVGESEKNCRELFAAAVAAQPSVIFIDEFDALGKSRGNGDNYGDKLLNQFLSCTSDLEKRGDKVIILGSTNRIEDIDPAILRSGRFDLHLEVKKPDLPSTKTILRLKTVGKSLEKNFDMDKIAEKMFSKGMTGADIYRIVRDAHINALDRTGIYKCMDNGSYNPSMLKNFFITEADFEKAIENFKPETKKRRTIGFRQN